jgi:hypothetical protein
VDAAGSSNRLVPSYQPQGVTTQKNIKAKERQGSFQKPGSNVALACQNTVEAGYNHISLCDTSSILSNGL